MAAHTTYAWEDTRERFLPAPHLHGPLHCGRTQRLHGLAKPRLSNPFHPSITRFQQDLYVLECSCSSVQNQPTFAKSEILLS